MFWFQNGIINEEEDSTFASEPDLFSIGTINLPLELGSSLIINTIHIKKTINTIDFNADFKVNHKVVFEILVNKVSKVALESKVYPKIYYHHKPNRI